ncbi:XRE family transcriptional regulator, partial [Listeria monocytogenes]|nr:XRE family transcriptional regulator [Listeria monocytogenes]
MNLIGLRIKNIRKEKQLTLKDVAQGIISVPYLANIENGIKVASLETLIHIARRLEIPEEVLL